MANCCTIANYEMAKFLSKIIEKGLYTVATLCLQVQYWNEWIKLRIKRIIEEKFGKCWKE